MSGVPTTHPGHCEMSNHDDAINLENSSCAATKVSHCDKHQLLDLHPSQVKRRRIGDGDSDGENDEEALNPKNRYTGFSLLPTGCTSAGKVDNQTGSGVIPIYVPILNDSQENITPLILWNDCISQRKPCVINGLPQSDSNHKLMGLDKEQLVRVAGQELVQVERRLDAKETFGQVRCSDRQLEMSVHDFCQALDKSDGHMLYLSTQEMDEEDTDDNLTDGSTATTPCKQLIANKIIPSTLLWGGNLILQSCNLWLGRSAGAAGAAAAAADNNAGTSSGLHHDFHDNFYILLHGTKSFRLFSPDCALHMDTYGEIDRIHPNGLISYVGNETRPDGLPIDDHDDTEDGALFGKGFAQNSESDTDCDEDNTFPMDGTRDDFDEICGHADDSERKPNNFSRIDLRGRSLEELRKEYDAFTNVTETVVHLKAGQSLYLPAGWFHEVTSESTKNHYHMALNYWFHPPDKLDDYDCPYTDKDRFAKV